MKEPRKWHEWINSAGILVALIFTGFTFYYQFVRNPRELSAIVLPLSWNANGTCTVRTVIWNDGTKDEVVEAAYLRLMSFYYDRPEGLHRLFGPEVIRPGEAKSITSVVAVDPNVLMKRVARDAFRTKRYALEERVHVVFHTVERSGKIVGSNAWVCNIWFREDNRVQTATRVERIKIDLLTGRRTPGDVEELRNVQDLKNEP